MRGDGSGLTAGLGANSRAGAQAEDLGGYNAGALVNPDAALATNVPIAEGRKRKLPPPVAIGWGVLALLLIMLGAFVALSPKTVVSVLPGAGRLYAMMGKPVSALGLKIENVRSTWTDAGGQRALQVDGVIVNTTSGRGERAAGGDRASRQKRQAAYADHHQGGAARRRRQLALQRANPGRARNREQPQGSLRQAAMTATGGIAAGAIKPLYSAEAIAARVDQLAHDIAARRLDDLMVVAVLKGSFIFAADLIRALHRHGLKPEIDFIYLASYDGERVSRGEVRVLRDVESDLRGRNVVIVDDIFDSGRTLSFAKELLAEHGAKRVLTCVLVDKQVPRVPAITPDFIGFSCPPVFVVGYGMDLHNRYRELPFIGELTGSG